MNVTKKCALFVEMLAGLVRNAIETGDELETADMLEGRLRELRQEGLEPAGPESELLFADLEAAIKKLRERQ